jgi:SAM-dependent methyltransferase
MSRRSRESGGARAAIPAAEEDANVRTRTIASLIPGRWKFGWRYWRGTTPWDTQVTPPEVLEFLSSTPPGTALDLGCGTGTNAVTLARHGWRVTGVDFVPKAIGAAREKAALGGWEIDFRIASVSDLSCLSGPFDYALDIGCLHALKPADRAGYAQGLSRLLPSKAWYMLYAWLPAAGGGGAPGISAEEVGALLDATFLRVRTVLGEESGRPSSWYWFRRR